MMQFRLLDFSAQNKGLPRIVASGQLARRRIVSSIGLEVWFVFFFKQKVTENVKFQEKKTDTNTAMSTSHSVFFQNPELLVHGLCCIFVHSARFFWASSHPSFLRQGPDEGREDRRPYRALGGHDGQHPIRAARRFGPFVGVFFQELGQQNYNKHTCCIITCFFGKLTSYAKMMIKKADKMTVVDCSGGSAERLDRHVSGRCHGGITWGVAWWFFCLENVTIWSSNMHTRCTCTQCFCLDHHNQTVDSMFARWYWDFLRKLADVDESANDSDSIQFEDIMFQPLMFVVWVVCC